MTIFDLLFIVLFLCALASVIAAIILALRGRGVCARSILLRLAVCAVLYFGAVYTVTAFSRPLALRIGDPQCDDDWCLAVESVKQVPRDRVMVYDVTLRIFSRARRVTQRETGAKDVYLVDAQWRRYDPVLRGSEIPLNAQLRPEESLTTRRMFEVPPDTRGIGLLIDRGNPWICVIIGECGAFHKGTVLRID